MRIMRFTILSLLTLLMLAIAIPAAAATCSICITEVTVREDGSQTSNARCEASTAGDIPDCRAFHMRGTAECDSVSLTASCGEGISFCAPWDWRCGHIQYVKAPRVHSMRRRRPSTV